MPRPLHNGQRTRSAGYGFNTGLNNNRHVPKALVTQWYTSCPVVGDSLDTLGAKS